MPRKKQDRPKHVTKWEDGAEGTDGPEGGSGSSGGTQPKDVCEDETSETNATAIIDECEAPPQQQSSSASDTEDNSVGINAIKTNESTKTNNNNNNKSNNKCDDNRDNRDQRDAQKIKCEALIRQSLTSSDSALTSALINAKHSSNNLPQTYLSCSSARSESDINSDKPSPQSTVQMETDDPLAPLDFSIKPNVKSVPKPILNGPQSLSKDNQKETRVRNDSPLDLTVGKRPSGQSSKSPIMAKIPRFDSSSPWNYSVPRVLTPPKQSNVQNDGTHVWNGKLKNNAISSKICSPTSSSPSSSTSPARVPSGSHSGRQNPWQTQWINRSSEQTRDVFTCVWCKQSFRSLAEMTDHMKKSPRCGMAGMQHATATTTATPHTTNVSPSGGPPQPSSHQASTSIPKEPISSSVLAKNNVGLPRKLVRGQDVWLGRGAEQTRQILKCMWCGQSFKTLADMTTHMRVTQHYTNIISQEQIISWRTPEDKLTQAQVNAVLTCKVCDEAFGSLKELSYHMVKNAHYKEHILRSITEGGHGRRRQTRERRKKSLPVRKLLELERREMTKEEKEESDSSAASGGPTGGQLIRCDDCHEKIEAKSFISHIKLCKAQVKLAMRSYKSDKSPDRVRSPSSSGSRSGPPSRGQTVSPQVEVKLETESEGKTHSGSEHKDESSEAPNESNPIPSETSSGFGSVLNAIEKLIEKSFDPKTRKTQSTGILQRLGIDEEVCPPWQHMPPMSWNRNGSQSDYYNDGRASSRSSGHQSSSPLPQELLRESNGSLSSADSSDCDDSNSCNSLTNNIGISLKSNTGSAQRPSPKLSFPISSLISNKAEEQTENKTKNLSPKSENYCHSVNSNPSTPQSVVNKSENITNDKSSDSEDEKSDKSIRRERYSASPLDLDIKNERNSSSPEKSENSTHINSTSNAVNLRRSENRKSCSVESSDTFHPLMQLQKLLDKTDSGKNKVNSSNINTNNSVGVSPSLLAFSWACNEATTSMGQGSTPMSEEKHHKSEHSIKCPYCDASFNSKGAFRHHFSKTHLKADKAFDLGNTTAPNSTNINNNIHNNCNDNISKEGNPSGGPGTSSNSETSIVANESPHSKFLKYTELAKQLSSKYV